jgi:hypothetical protein
MTRGKAKYDLITATNAAIERILFCDYIATARFSARSWNRSLPQDPKGGRGSDD